jgi:hypothetical protein
VRRSYNQALYDRLRVRPEEDDDTGQSRIRVSEAELASPFDVLLAPDFPSERWTRPNE